MMTDGGQHPDMPDALRELGLNEAVLGVFAPLGEQGMQLGRVVRVDRGLPLVHTSKDGAVRAEPAPHLARAAERAGNRAAVGDWVALGRPEGHEAHVIEAILPRSSAFVRKDPGERTGEQVVAANIDTVLVVQVAVREPNLRRLERELVLAWDSGARPVVVVSKIDAFDGDRADLLDQLRAAAPGCDVLLTSGTAGEGIGDVRAQLPAGTTGALLGASGVGKSTLVNALVGERVQETREVREADGKGRHTTVAREIVTIPGAGAIIDTPGLRALALWDVERGMSLAFADIEELAAACRFRDCAHVDEPGCAVRQAIAEDGLPGRRLESYLDLRAELDELARRRERQAWQRKDGGQRR